jgi:NNP family nitrate/nitrite transporter-like MFS transporter
MSAMFSMIVLRMKACPQHNTGKEGVTISLNKAR